jgi:hypothetical protein
MCSSTRTSDDWSACLDLQKGRRETHVSGCHKAIPHHPVTHTDDKYPALIGKGVHLAVGPTIIRRAKVTGEHCLITFLAACAEKDRDVKS